MEISDIKSKLSLQTVLIHYNLTPDKNHRLSCPWHSDKTPSLQLYPKTNTWTCFSSNCTAGSGDQIEFIKRYESLSDHEALKKATELAGGERVSMSRTAILLKYWQNSLHAMKRSKKGKIYAERRGLKIEQIGYCGYEVGKSWSEALKKQSEKIGLFTLKNCIVFPTKNEAGQIISLYGRSVSDSKASRHFYLKGGFKGLYPNYPKKETRQLILTESIIDAATLKQNTEHEVLALYGTNGFTEAHKKAIESLEDLEELVLFFDGDEAGRAAVEKYTEQFKTDYSHLKISKVETPEGEDANSLIIGHEPEILNHLIENRVLLFSSMNERTSIEAKRDSASSERTAKADGRQKATPKKHGKLNTDNAELLIYETESLNLTILGGIKITGLDRLKVTLKIERKEYTHHLPVRHSLDLYHSKQVESLAQKMSEKLELTTSESERVISRMTGELENYRRTKLELLKPKKPQQKTMSEAERAAAIKYLKNKKLLRNTLEDIAKSGIVGERNNALIAYLAYTSRRREKPLHIMCLGASGSGKTYLQERVSELIPEEEKIEITSLSDNAFYYFGREELKHKLILIEDLDGAENVLYPLRELQSKRRISKTVTLKDTKGNLKTITLKVEGPVCVSGCTTREKIYEDNANRCILLYIDESAEQDKRIMNYQQKASAGAIDQAAENEIIERIKNVQRLLKPIKIINPFAQLIDLPAEVFKPRRTLLLLLSFIETITFYHQYQRKIKTNPTTGERYIETEKSDIEAAFSLLKEALFSKSDELTNASRKLLERLKKEVEPSEVFYAGAMRKKLRMPLSTLKRHLLNLGRNGYIKIKGGSKYRGYEYQISDYEEYQKLQNKIDSKLQSILKKVEEQLSGSLVAHSQNEPVNAL